MDRSDPDDPSKPAWWRENQRLRDQLGLPPYEPPRFRDGTPTYRVTDDLEAEHECTIRFRGKNTSYPDEFDVVVDGSPAFRVGRHRDENANTVYELTADEFRARFEAVLGEGAADR